MRFCLLVTFLNTNIVGFSLVVTELNPQELKTRVVASIDADRELVPASLIKPFIYQYATENIADFSPAQRHYCPGWADEGKLHSCWLKPGHRWVNAQKALATSCNAYFYQLAPRLNFDKYVDWLQQKYFKNWPRSIDNYDTFIGNTKTPISLLALNKAFASLVFTTLFNKFNPHLWAGLSMSFREGGTLHSFSQVSQKSQLDTRFNFLAGKTGTVYRQKKLSRGNVWLLFQHLETKKMYSLIITKEKTRSMDVAGSTLAPWLKEWQKKLNN